MKTYQFGAITLECSPTFIKAVESGIDYGIEQTTDPSYVTCQEFIEDIVQCVTCDLDEQTARRIAADEHIGFIVGVLAGIFNPDLQDHKYCRFASVEALDHKSRELYYVLH